MNSIKKQFAANSAWLLLVFLINLVIMIEPFLHSGKPALLDSNAHIYTMAGYKKALESGDFPVMWIDTFANYGLPLGSIAHQLTNYLGAVITFLTSNPLFSYYILILLAYILSSTGIFVFLKLFLPSSVSFLGTFIYSYSTYRITNFYVRGALPELFAAIWLPYLLITLYFIGRSGQKKHYIFYILLLALLLLTHPMSIVLYVPFVLFSAIFFIRQNWKKIVILAISTILSFAIVSYYLLPLIMESKYLYMGANSNLFVNNQSVSLQSILSASPKYECKELNYIFWRCADIRLGVFEVILMFFVFVSTGYIYFRNRADGIVVSKNSESLDNSCDTLISNRILLYSITMILASLFFSSQASEYLYKTISFLGSIQIPSRFLAILYFFLSVCIAIFYKKIIYKTKTDIFVWSIIIILVVILQFPLIYGKNYTKVNPDSFYFSVENYHGLMLQPKWTLDSTSYSIQREKGKIVSGVGNIRKSVIKNSSREYIIDAQTDLIVSDGTFYFPGWKVYIDGIKSEPEFQNPDYRGVITFNVPPGEHDVRVVYEDTKVRSVGKTISVLSLFILLGITLLPINRLKVLLAKK